MSVWALSQGDSELLRVSLAIRRATRRAISAAASSRLITASRFPARPLERQAPPGRPPARAGPRDPPNSRGSGCRRRPRRPEKRVPGSRPRTGAEPARQMQLRTSGVRLDGAGEVVIFLSLSRITVYDPLGGKSCVGHSMPGCDPLHACGRSLRTRCVTVRVRVGLTIVDKPSSSVRPDAISYWNEAAWAGRWYRRRRWP